MGGPAPPPSQGSPPLEEFAYHSAPEDCFAAYCDVHWAEYNFVYIILALVVVLLFH